MKNFFSKANDFIFDLIILSVFFSHLIYLFLSTEYGSISSGAGHAGPAILLVFLQSLFPYLTFILGLSLILAFFIRNHVLIRRRIAQVIGLFLLLHYIYVLIF